MIKNPTINDLWHYLSQIGQDSAAKINLVQSVCQTDLSDYPEGDSEHIFISLRGMVKDYIVSGQFQCTDQKCDDTILYRLDIKKLDSQTLPNDFERDYSFIFPISKQKKNLNLITVNKRVLIEEYLDMHRSADREMRFSDIYKDSESGIGLDELVRFACMFSDSVDFTSIEENIAFILKLDFSDFEVLMLYDVMFNCGPKLYTRCECMECKKQYNVKIDTNSAFFGLSLDSLLRKHKFLAKTSNISFADFKEYTPKEMENVTAIELSNKKK